MNESEISLMAEFILEIESLAGNTSYAGDRPVYERLLSHSAIIISKLIKEKPIGDDISTMEKLLGNSCLMDNESCSEAYEAWNRFKWFIVRSVCGMTVNERLFNLGLIDDFDAAVSKRDKAGMRAVLLKSFLDEKNIEEIIATELNRK